MNREAHTSRCVVSSNTKTTGRHVSRACNSCGRRAGLFWPSLSTVSTILSACLNGGRFLVTVLDAYALHGPRAAI